MRSDRTQELRRALDDDGRRLETAVAALKKAAASPLDLGRHMARSPWTWMLVAGAAGAWLGLRRRHD